MAPEIHKTHHHILPNKVAFAVGGTLLFLTLVTVWVAGVDLGRFNFIVAMLVATIKASMVALIFMNLKYDHKENAVIFGASFLFLAIFITFTATDLFFRGDVYWTGKTPFPGLAEAKSKFKKPWERTPELLAHGKTLFNAQCASCHGVEGKGNGPAAAALVPPPRNFTAGEGWKVGRKTSQVFKTVTEGLPGTPMPPFGTLPKDDRWALAHYVLSLGPTAPADTPADLAKVGVDPSKEDGGAEVAEKTIPVKFAMKRMAEPGPNVRGVYLGAADHQGGTLFQQRCVGCHGMNGEGGIKVQNIGLNPKAFVVTQPLSGVSADRFNRVVTEGLPGLMPGSGDLSSSEISGLYQHVRSAR